MKKIIVNKNKKNIAFIFVLCLFIASFNTIVATSIQNDLDIKQNNTYVENLLVIKIDLSKSSTFGLLVDNNIPILELDKEKNFALVLMEPKELIWLESINISYKVMYNSIAEMNGWIQNPKLLEDFTTYSELITELSDIEATYPDIAKLYDLGHSVQDRTIWGLKITDNPDIEEDEPEVRICGAHHGNELMSIELPLLLAWYLVDNYANDSYIQGLVDNREIWIIPMVNPDGREANTRYNANGIDLNRDYGYMWGVYSDCFTQPETQTIRSHALDNNFVLSLSMHCSGDIVNYIWNYKGQPVPDNSVVVSLSQQYGSHNGYWVVEGYDWYQTKGDTNDFSYGCRGDIDWTIEVQSNNIQGAWNLNRDAMIEIIDAADMGLRGIVTDATTGDPIAATIWLEEVFWPCFTDPKIGDYHKVLLPGTYTVHFKANGYEEEVHTVTITSSFNPTILDVSLDRAENYYAYQVTQCRFMDPYNYPNNYQNNPTEAVSALGPPDDICASLGKGGSIVLDMGVNIVDQVGQPDFKVFEADGSDDGYYVRVSQEWDGPWVNLPNGFGTTEFDLDDGSIEWIRYIKIIDDNDGNEYETNPGVDIDAIENLAGMNLPPYNPQKPVGPNHGNILVEYTFSTSTTDPEGEDVYYMWDWGNDTYSDWLGPYSSGETIETDHMWENEGQYDIRVKAKDSDNVESGWSDPLTITIGEGPVIEIGEVKGGLFKISMVIKNVGSEDAYGVEWNINLENGLVLIGSEHSGIAVGIQAGGETTVYTDPIIGLGKPTVKATAEIPDGSGDFKEFDARLLLFLINIT